MSGSIETEAAVQSLLSGSHMPVSSQLVVRRAGLHLAQIVQRLCDLEALLLPPGAPASDNLGHVHRVRLQALDLTIQELSGLSDILVATSGLLGHDPDPRLDAFVDLPRLQSLAHVLRGTVDTGPGSAVVIF